MRRHELGDDMNRLHQWLPAVACLLLAAGAHAQQPLQALDAIQATAEDFVRTQLPQTSGKYFLSASRLDPRLRLAECTVPLEPFLQSPGALTAHTTVGVRCASHNQWTVFVQVALEQELSVLVLRRPLARRARIVVGDVELQTRRVPGLGSNFISDLTILEGRRLRRALPAGAALTPDALATEVLIKRGQQVTLLAANGGIQIRAQGHALTEGSANERIRVQNVNSLKIVEGVIENAGTVRVDL
jgi:flagellar basal body P-ring formation protein FlgA